MPPGIRGQSLSTGRGHDASGGLHLKVLAPDQATVRTASAYLVFVRPRSRVAPECSCVAPLCDNGPAVFQVGVATCQPAFSQSCRRLPDRRSVRSFQKPTARHGSRPIAWCSRGRSSSASRRCWLIHEGMSSGTATSLTVSVSGVTNLAHRVLGQETATGPAVRRKAQSTTALAGVATLPGSGRHRRRRCGA